MKCLRRSLQHCFNPLHVFCKLRRAGFGIPLARRMSSAYERYLYRVIMN